MRKVTIAALTAAMFLAISAPASAGYWWNGFYYPTCYWYAGIYQCN